MWILLPARKLLSCLDLQLLVYIELVSAPKRHVFNSCVHWPPMPSVLSLKALWIVAA
jgi:hypothetical protein